jgi:copper transport protein
MKRNLAAFTLATGILAWAWTSAQAHALLVRSSPEANASLATAPRFVELVFSEALEPSFSTASVLNADGQRLDNNDANVDTAIPTRVTLTLRPLPDGVYTVTWKVLSAVDGHVTTGVFAFSVGSAVSAPSAAGPSTSGGATPVGEVLARWLMFFGAAILFGGAVFLLAVWDPAVRRRVGGAHSSPPPSGPWPSLARLGAVVFLLANVLGLWAQAAQATGGPTPLPWDPVLDTVLFTTRFGALWTARVLLGLGLAALLPRARSIPARLAGLALGAALLLSLSLGSHAATESKPALPVIGDWVHLAAACLWVGGLGYFVAGLIALRPLPDRLRTQLVAELIPRFSRVALPTVAFLVASGTYASVLRVGSWSGLFGTTYGQTLMSKILIAVIMVAFGASNLLFITPRMHRSAGQPAGSPRLVNLFRRIVTTESLLGAGALLAAALLTSLPPARVPTAPASLTMRGAAADLRVLLEVSPGRVGANTFTVTVTSDGEPVVGAKEVGLRFEAADFDIPQSTAVLQEVGGGRYRGQGTYLSLPDRWRVQVAVRREGGFDALVHLTVDLRPPGAGRGLPWPRLTGVLLVVAALAGWAVVRRRRAAILSQALQALPSAALALAGVALFARPLPTGHLLNPIPATAASIAAGRVLYETNCVACHGARGKGDGPLGLTLNPPPADLTLHTIPGVHPDGQLYDWITNGYSGSVMPAFRDRLSDTLRWDLVNFLRTMAPASSP